MTEVYVGTGGAEIITTSILGLVNEGEEVIIIEPAFDFYLPSVVLAGGIPKAVKLLPPSEGDLVKAFSPKTKMIIFNTPHNPTGKIFDKEELEFIANLALKNKQTIILSDEVYFHLSYKKEHIRIATFPNIAGKLFSATGWKIGWGIGPKELIQPSTICKQFTGFSNASVGQIAIAQSLLNNSPYKGSDNYFKHINEQCLKNAERMCNILSKVPGVRPLMPEGGYFILADISQAEFDRSLDNRLDYAFCKSIVKSKKVGAIPVSAFFSNYTPDNFARFTVCKLQQSIDEFENKIL